MNKPVVFFDGDCGFCNKSVQFTLRHEKDPSIQFASLQSQFALSFFQAKNLAPDLSTFYFYDGKKLYDRSTAALKIIPFLKWYLQIGIIGWLIPKKLRDKVYNFVANRRMKISNGFCVVLSETQKSRFHLVR